MVRPDAKSERNAAIMAMVAEGATYTLIAAHFGISQPRVAQIVLAERAKMPVKSRADMIQELTAELERAREVVRDVLEAPSPVAMSNGEPVPLRMEDGTLIEGRYAADVSARLSAASALTGLQNRQARLHGLDQPTQVSTEQTVTVRIEGAEDV